MVNVIIRCGVRSLVLINNDSTKHLIAIHAMEKRLGDYDLCSRSFQQRPPQLEGDLSFLRFLVSTLEYFENKICL